MKYPKKPHVLNKHEELITDYAGIDWLYALFDHNHPKINRQYHKINKKWIGVSYVRVRTNIAEKFINEHIQS